MSNHTTLSESDFSLRHLEAELLRIDVLIHREVWRWQRAGQDPTDAFRGQYVSDAEASALVKRPFGMSCGQTVTLKPEEKQTRVNGDDDQQNAQNAVDDVFDLGQLLFGGR